MSSHRQQPVAVGGAMFSSPKVNFSRETQDLLKGKLADQPCWFNCMRIFCVQQSGQVETLMLFHFYSNNNVYVVMCLCSDDGRVQINQFPATSAK